MTVLLSTWPPPPTQLKLEGGQVHVWCASLELQPITLSRLETLLAKDEQARANRFVFERDRQHFIAARARLRLILSRYLTVTPQSLRFRYGPQGKPELTGGNGGALHFNLSHSHGLALVAVTQERHVGVDLEQVRVIDDMDSIARRFFSKVEYQAYTALPLSQKSLGFFNCWTRKEAYIKAIGQGLSCPLADFDVSLTPGEPAKLLSIKDNRQLAELWSITTVDPAAGYVGAVVVEEPTPSLSCWHWADT
ncbi:MAG: 4'-phosphopantetheinyl transferase superfamily protein [Anaerolineae bacterium]|nr:4'-phosphopantetheinyl transferase superfamily protein [Anaerolineae bacterium]